MYRVPLHDGIGIDLASVELDHVASLGQEDESQVQNPEELLEELQTTIEPENVISETSVGILDEDVP